MAMRLSRAAAAAAALLAVFGLRVAGAPAACPSTGAPDAQCAAGRPRPVEDEVNLLTMSTQVHLRMAEHKGAAGGPHAEGAAAAAEPPASAAVAAVAAPPAGGASAKDLHRLDPLGPVNDGRVGTVTLPLSLVYSLVLSFWVLLAFAVYLVSGCGELLTSVTEPCRRPCRCRRKGLDASTDRIDSDFLFRVLAENSKKDVLYVGAEGAVKLQEDSSDDCSLPRPEIGDEEPDVEPEIEVEGPPGFHEATGADDVSSPWAQGHLCEAEVEQLVSCAADQVLRVQGVAMVPPELSPDHFGQEDSCAAAARPAIDD